MARKNLTPTKQELAQYKVMHEMGYTPHAIGKKMNRDPKTVRKYLQSDVYNDPEITQIIDIIKENEIKDLYIIGAKARSHINKLLDEGNMKAIESVATLDRTFQQRRILEGLSTQHIFNVHADIVEHKRILRAKGSKPREL